jgi:hypothetical protein
MARPRGFAVKGQSVFESKSTSLGPVLVGILLLCSCDQSPPRFAVSGTITFRKAPLKNGTITFYPLSTGTQAGTGISNGKYEIAREKGLQPGTYRVSISSPDGETPAQANAVPGPSGNFASKERIPADFNEKSKHEIEVTSAGPNQFDFTIP